MNTYKRTKCLLVFGLAAVFAPSFAHADDAEGVLGFGALRGVALDAAGKPVGMVNVAIHSMDGAADRKATSDGEGVFAADLLKPGSYQISAVKEGISSPPVLSVEIAANQVARPYLLIVDAAKPAAAPPTLEQELTAMKE